MKKPLISLKIVNKNGQKVCVLTTRKRKRIYSFLKADDNEECVYLLCVKYEDGYENNGDYENSQDVIEALRQFLD